ncbi:hypothetical protein Tco_1368746 [Tanacetum coccineum]
MSRANPQATIVSEEQLVPRANRLVIKKNNQRVASDSDITDTITVLRMSHPDPNKTYTKPPLETQILGFIKTLGYDEDHDTKMIAVSKMSIPRRSNSELHSTQDDQPITKLSNTVKAKKKESVKDKIVDEPEEQRVSPVKSGRGKGFMCYHDQVMNVPKKDDVLRKTRSLAIIKETVVDMYAEWGQKLKGHIIEDPAVQSLLDLQKRSKVSRLKNLKQKNQTVVGEGSSNAHNKHYVDSDTDSDGILCSSCSDITEESDNEPDDADDSDMDLSDDNPDGDNDSTRFGVFMYNKSTKTPNSTYFSPTVTSSSLDIIQNILNETPANELTNFVSNLVYTDAQTTSADMFPDENAHQWFPKKSGSANLKRRTKWFDLLLKSDIDKNENHILGPSTIAIVKNLKELIQKDELTIAYLEGVGLERLKQQYKNDVELEYHVDQLKAAVLIEAKWSNDEDDVTEEKYTTSITKNYAARYYIQAPSSKKGSRNQLGKRRKESLALKSEKQRGIIVIEEKSTLAVKTRNSMAVRKTSRSYQEKRMSLETPKTGTHTGVCQRFLDEHDEKEMKRTKGANGTLMELQALSETQD